MPTLITKWCYKYESTVVQLLVLKWDQAIDAESTTVNGKVEFHQIVHLNLRTTHNI